jgi:hypothetical protein
MSEKKHIAVVGNSKTTRVFMEQRGKGLVHGGWTNDKNFLKEIEVLKEMESHGMYGAVIVDMEDRVKAAAIAERIYDGLIEIGVKIPVIVLDDRRCAERQVKILLIPRNGAEVAAAARNFGIID